MNADEARKVSKFLLHGWPGDFTEEGLVIYLDALMPLPFEAVAVAIKGMLLTEKFRPSIAEIYENAMFQVGGAAPRIDDALMQGRAYHEYLAQLQWSNGSGYEPRKPKAHPAVVRVCESMSVEGFNEITFSKIYSDVSKRFNDAALRHLTNPPTTAIKGGQAKEIGS